MLTARRPRRDDPGRAAGLVQLLVYIRSGMGTPRQGQAQGSATSRVSAAEGEAG